MHSPDILFTVSWKQDEGDELTIRKLVVDGTHKAATFPSQVSFGGFSRWEGFTLYRCVSIEVVSLDERGSPAVVHLLLSLQVVPHPCCAWTQVTVHLDNINAEPFSNLPQVKTEELPGLEGHPPQGRQGRWSSGQTPWILLWHWHTYLIIKLWPFSFPDHLRPALSRWWQVLAAPTLQIQRKMSRLTRLLLPGELLQPSQPLCHGGKVLSPVLLHQLCLLLQSQSLHLDGRGYQGLLWLLSPAPPFCGFPTQSQGLRVFYQHHSATFQCSSTYVWIVSHLLRSPVVNSTTSCKLAMSDLYLGGFKTWQYYIANLSKMVVSNFLIRPISAAAPALPKFTSERRRRRVTRVLLRNMIQGGRTCDWGWPFCTSSP